MTYDITTLACIAGIQFAAALLQSTVGFAYALFATPLLVQLGLSLPQAMGLVCVSSLVQTSTGVRRLSHEVRWPLVWSSTLQRYAATVLGTLALRHLARLPTEDVRMTVGLVIGAVVVAQIVVRPVPREQLAPFWSPVAFLSSGLLAGLFGMGGPPVVLWTMAHNWSNARTRAFLFAVFLLSLPFQIVLLAMLFPKELRYGATIAAASLPVLLAGTYAGMRVGDRLPKQLLQVIAYVLLVLIAANAAGPRLIHYLSGALTGGTR
jgi:uncharacterized protein